MATTIVRQSGLQSCLEDSMTLTLKLSTTPNKKLHLSNTASSSTGGGWSFFQLNQPPKDNEDIYVHPLLKSRLSDKSLEMCTENLGSETGSDHVPDDHSIFSLSSSSEEDSDREYSPPARRPRKQIIGRRDLPPPLTTISGSESVRIRSRREGGRMVMEAVKVSSAQTLIHSERSHGRLRLYILDSVRERNCDCDCEREESENCSVEMGEEGEETERGTVEDVMGGIDLKNEGRMGIEEFQRLSRCKEGEIESKGLMNWEPFCWVATS